MPAVPVSDTRSSRNDNIVAIVEGLGRSEDKLKLFKAVYYHKKNIKTTDELSQATGFDAKKVLTLGGQLDGVAFHKVKEGGRVVGYEKERFVVANKKKILGLVGNRAKLAKVPTKTSPRMVGVVRAEVPAPPAGRVRPITINDVDNFANAKRLHRSPAYVPLSEAAFKRGIRTLVGEPYDQRDWGGEKGDLVTTRVRIKGQRYTAAFAFKGPGKRGILTPAGMGKRGDQIANLFDTDAQVFFVQYWAQIDPTVLNHMHVFAQFKAGARKQTIWYGVVDGADSARLITAYPKAFGRKRPTRKKRGLA